MDLHDCLTILTEQGSQITWLEWISTLSQIASVYYAQKNNVWVYPTGIAGVLIAAYLYFFVAVPPLYAEGSVHIYYFAMSCYGWWIWTRKNQRQEYQYPIRFATPLQRWQSLGLWLGSWMVLYLILRFVTDSNTPIADSGVSASAITAMWLMANRKIENWTMWIVSNFLAIPLHVYKGFYAFALMYVVFLMMAVIGHIKWVRAYKHDLATVE